MYTDYQSLVMRHYKKKIYEHQLPSELEHPTTAKLKAECHAKAAKGFLQKDRKTLVDFFGESEDNNSILKKIKRRRPDDFKPLWNYLTKDIKKPNPKNVELLAWLTDFEDRPYDDRKAYCLEDLQANVTMPEKIKDVEEEAEKEDHVEEKKIIEAEVVEEPPQILAPIVADKPIPIYDVEEKVPLVALPSTVLKQRTNQKAIIATLVIAILAVAGIFMYTANGGKRLENLMQSTFNKDGGCMYWAEDHYQQVPCSQKMGSDTLVIALDTEKLYLLRKITRRDTITKNSKGWVWYIKVNNKVEFYTAGGNYPLDPTLKLKPITDYIINKYIDTTR